MDNSTTQTIKKASLRSLYQNGYFQTISTLRQNKSGYAFITALDKNKKAANLYFGKGTNELVLDNFKVGDNITAFLSDADIIMTQTEEQVKSGEWRFKITKNGSKYSSESDLQQAFGDVSNETFDFDLFKAEFSDSASNALKVSATPEVTTEA